IQLGIMMLSGTLLFSACDEYKGNPKATGSEQKKEAAGYDPNFKVNAEAFADLQLLRYQVPGFNELSLQQKTLAYYLYEAALAGRDIYYDQAGKYGLTLRKTI